MKILLSLMGNGQHYLMTSGGGSAKVLVDYTFAETISPSELSQAPVDIKPVALGIMIQYKDMLLPSIYT